jgi:hypothetical protein
MIKSTVVTTWRDHADEYALELSCGCMIVSRDARVEWFYTGKVTHTCARELQPAPPPQLQAPRLGRVA